MKTITTSKYTIAQTAPIDSGLIWSLMSFLHRKDNKKDVVDLHCNFYVLTHIYSLQASIHESFPQPSYETIGKSKRDAAKCK